MKVETINASGEPTRLLLEKGDTFSCYGIAFITLTEPFNNNGHIVALFLVSCPFNGNSRILEIMADTLWNESYKVF